MNFIDTHCHLFATEFGENQAVLLQSAQAAGVGVIVVPAVSCDNFSTVQKLCEQHPGCLPAYGIHPMFVDDAADTDLELLRSYLHSDQAAAVGEIGLDFFIENYDQVRQENFFAAQLKLAQEFDLPVLIHSRKAMDTVLKHLRRIKVRGGIAHAFNGSRQQAEELIKLGFKLGFGGAATHPRATRLRELAATLPLSSIVLETDAPDMPPEFIERGQPNKPEYLPRIAQIIAQLRGMPLNELAQATSENAQSVLKLPRPL